MNFNIIDKKILNNKFSISYKNGQVLFKRGYVKFIDIKNLDDCTVIYGRVLEGIKTFRTFIKINNNDKVEL